MLGTQPKAALSPTFTAAPAKVTIFFFLLLLRFSHYHQFWQFYYGRVRYGFHFTAQSFINLWLYLFGLQVQPQSPPTPLLAPPSSSSNHPTTHMRCSDHVPLTCHTSSSSLLPADSHGWVVSSDLSSSSLMLSPNGSNLLLNLFIPVQECFSLLFLWECPFLPCLSDLSSASHLVCKDCQQSLWTCFYVPSFLHVCVNVTLPSYVFGYFLVSVRHCAR